MTIEALKDRIVEILENKKAEEIEVLPIAEKSSLADYLIVASGTAVPHVKALADEVEYQLKKEESLLPRQVEGQDSGRWILLDYGDIIVHVFHPEERAYYSLEQLWRGKLLP